MRRVTEKHTHPAGARGPEAPGAAVGARMLRVVQAIPKDVDRATIRVDPATLRELDVAEGSFEAALGALVTRGR